MSFLSGDNADDLSGGFKIKDEYILSFSSPFLMLLILALVLSFIVVVTVVDRNNTDTQR